MGIDLNKLNYQDKISIDEVISYNKDYLSNSGILKLDDVKFVRSMDKKKKQEDNEDGNSMSWAFGQGFN